MTVKATFKLEGPNLVIQIIAEPMVAVDRTAARAAIEQCIFVENHVIYDARYNEHTQELCGVLSDMYKRLETSIAKHQEKNNGTRRKIILL